jgi:hypothetical protein
MAFANHVGLSLFFYTHNSAEFIGINNVKSSIISGTCYYCTSLLAWEENPKNLPESCPVCHVPEAIYL